MILSTIFPLRSKALLRTLVRLPSFERSARGLLGEEENRWLDNTLAANPTAGVVMRGTGGVRKLRIALEGRGKSGGARVIYYYLGRKQRIFLVSVYAKNEADNVSAAELRQMRKLT